MATLRRAPAVRGSKRRGAAAIEFAVTLPLIVFVLFGTVEYGHYFSQLAMVTNAARDGARFGSNQTTLLGARTQGAAATRILLEDVGFACDLADPCAVIGEIVQRSGVTMVKVTVRMPHEPLTHALPSIGVGGGRLGMPSSLTASGIFPVVGF